MTEVGRTRKELIEHLERNGTMDRRRAELTAWFQAHPRGTPLQAVRALRFTHPDHMYVVADSIWMDFTRGKGVMQ